MLDVKKLLIKYNWVALIIVIVLIFYSINPLFFKDRLDHKAPQGFLAGDAYWHTAYVQYVKERGSYDQSPQYMLGDLNQTVVPEEPPQFFYTAAIFADIFGLQHYDASIFTCFLLLVLGICLVYVLLNQINPLLPYLGLPVVLLQARFPFQAAISWGFWKLFYACIIVLLFVTMIILVKRTWVNMLLLAAVFTVVIFAHPSIAMYVVFALAVLFVYEMITGYKDWKRIFLQYLALAGMTLAMSSLYIYNLIMTRLFSASSQFVGADYTLYGANVYIAHLGFIFWLAIPGAILAFFIKPTDKRQYMSAILIFLVEFILLLGPEYGFGRALQFRLVWPLFIAIFFGLTALFAASFIKNGIAKSAFVLLVFVLLSANIYASATKGNAQIEKIPTYSIMSENYWGAFDFVSKTDAKRVFLIDPVFNQGGIILNTFKYTRYLDGESASKNISIGREAKIFCIGPKVVYDEYKRYCNSSVVMDTCKFGYYVIHLSISDNSQQGWLMDQIAIMQDKNMTLVYRNDESAIFKNNEVC